MMHRRPNYSVLIRTDGDEDLGIGHIKRCIAIGVFFKKKQIQPIFLVRHINSKASKK